jgi:hypothetical protein
MACLQAIPIMLALVVAGSSFSQVNLGGDISGMTYDLSKFNPKEKVPLVRFQSGTTAGIYRNEAKNGQVAISRSGHIVSRGAGVFLGSRDQDYPDTLKNGEILRQVGRDSLREVGVQNAVSHIWFEGVVQQLVTIGHTKDGKEASYKMIMIKPTAGFIGTLTIDGTPVALKDRDLSDGSVTALDARVFDVYFPSKIQRLSGCYLVERSSGIHPQPR